MNHSYKIVFFFLSLVSYSHGQENLILNGDFEEYWQCPDALTQIARCKYVFNPCLPPNWQAPQWSSTSDYFNRCSTQFDCDAPSNTFGYQQPRSGNGYIGLIHSQSFGNYKEYIQLSFNHELTAYATYRFTVYVSISDAGGWSTDFIQFKFTDTVQYYSTYLSDVMTPDTTLFNLNLTDSLSWIELSFDYVAKGSEKYVIIGDFNINSDNDCFYVFKGSDSLVSSPFGGQSYLFFDNASLIKIKEAEAISFPNVFTPNGDGINETFKVLTGLNQVSKITIFNRWGNTVYSSDSCFSWDGNDQRGKPLADGVYFVLVESKVEKERYEGMVHLIR